MPTQADLDWDNTVSKNRQGETRNQRSRAREMKDRMNSALRDATSTKERREIKREFNLNTNKASSQTDNQMGVNEDSNQRGDDNFKPDYYEIPEGGGESLAGIEIIWADQTETFITAADILDDYDGEDYWSAVFAVSSGAFTKSVSYDSTQDLWNDVGTAQAVYRLRVKTLNTVASPNAPTQLSAYGQYREEILCVDGDPVVNLIKIS